MRLGLAAMWMVAASLRVHAADIYGYLDSKGVAHLAAEKLDERYQLFFKDGQNFDTAQGLGSRLGGAAVDAKASPTTRALLDLFEKSPHYKSAQIALRDAAQRNAIDYELLQALTAAESGFDAQAVSPKGAIGLMQLMPETAQRYGVQADKKRSLESKLTDPRINVATGSRYLRDLIALFDGRLDLALAAYNAGEGAVQRAGDRVPDYPETRNYVKTVLQLYAWLKPGGAAAMPRGRVPGRVRMELAGAASSSSSSAPAAE